MALVTSAIVAALAPAAVDFIKGLGGGLARKLGGLSVDDEIKLKNADVERLKALAALDAPVGSPSQWIVDLRASFRYVAAGVFVVGGLLLVFSGDVLAPLGIELAVSASSFIFGERMLLSLYNRK